MQIKKELPFIIGLIMTFTLVVVLAKSNNPYLIALAIVPCMIGSAYTFSWKFLFDESTNISSQKEAKK